jgi:hypothetical protein
MVSSFAPQRCNNPVVSDPLVSIGFERLGPFEIGSWSDGMDDIGGRRLSQSTSRFCVLLDQVANGRRSRGADEPVRETSHDRPVGFRYDIDAAPRRPRRRVGYLIAEWMLGHGEQAADANSEAKTATVERFFAARLPAILGAGLEDLAAALAAAFARS